MKRPSHKELFNKLRSARIAVNNGQIVLLNQLALAADAIELKFSIEHDLKTILSELLAVSSPAHCTGVKPPQRSYEEAIRGLELFAFAVESKRFNSWIYFKFAMKEKVFWLVSLHPDRQMKEEL